jgi:hypothetical protein
LGIATHRSDKRIGISPTVGVRSEKVEALVEKYWGRPAPTISILLGYVMPQQRHLEWLFDPLAFDISSEARKLAEAIGAYGVPFMKENSALDVIIDDLEKMRFSFSQSVAYRLPAAYTLVGAPNLAVE